MLQNHIQSLEHKITTMNTEGLELQSQNADMRQEGAKLEKYARHLEQKLEQKLQSMPDGMDVDAERSFDAQRSFGW